MKIELEGNTRFEKARLIGSRALQISMGAPVLVKLSEQELEKIRYNPVEIAKMEFEKGLLPIETRRKLPVVERFNKAEKGSGK